MRVMVTGAAGFIGMHTAEALLRRGDEVVGVDNLIDYYDVDLKSARLERLKLHPGFSFHKLNVEDRAEMAALFEREPPQRVIHLAAQVGVRYSLVNPDAYIASNLQGFISILEGCRQHEVEHLVYASSSSVYGGNTAMPFSEHDNIDHPISLYAATKKSNELMAHSYSHLFGIPATALRFFTVYGPWGRPDMALSLFMQAMVEGRAINLFNGGKMARDFTYIDDIVEGVVRVCDKPATAASTFDPSRPDPATSNAPFRVFNIGNSESVPLLDYVQALEQATGITAKKNLMPMQPGDVLATSADTSELEAWVGFKPSTPMPSGVQKFVDWYRHHYQTG